MATVNITIKDNEINYDAKECEAKDFAAIINASIHHLKIEFIDKGEDVSEFIPGILKQLETLSTK